MAVSAAWMARSSPRAEPMPMRALPAPCMTDLTSAKSRLIRPGVVMRSVIPWTPESSTWSADRNASSTLTCLSLIESSRSLGMVMRVSTSSRRPAMPESAWLARRRPSNVKGRVTTPMVSAPRLAGDPGDDGSTAGARAAALARGDEDHVGALEHLLDLLRVILGGLAADLRISTGAEATRELAADVELDVGVAHEQRLRVRVDGDELDALEPHLDHAVDGVDAAAADTDDLDDGKVVLRCCHVRCLSLAVGGGDSHPQVEGYSYVNQLLFSDRTGASRATQRPAAACRHARRTGAGQETRGGVGSADVDRPRVAAGERPTASRRGAAALSAGASAEPHNTRVRSRQDEPDAVRGRGAELDDLGPDGGGQGLADAHRRGHRSRPEIVGRDAEERQPGGGRREAEVHSLGVELADAAGHPDPRDRPALEHPHDERVRPAQSTDARSTPGTARTRAATPALSTRTSDVPISCSIAVRTPGAHRADAPSTSTAVTRVNGDAVSSHAATPAPASPRTSTRPSRRPRRTGSGTGVRAPRRRALRHPARRGRRGRADADRSRDRPSRRAPPGAARVIPGSRPPVLARASGPAAPARARSRPRRRR